MELSIEEAVDILFELLGCSIVVILLPLFMRSDGWMMLLERLC